MGVLLELWSAVNCRLGAVEVGAADTATSPLHHLLHLGPRCGEMWGGTSFLLLVR